MTDNRTEEYKAALPNPCSIRYNMAAETVVIRINEAVMTIHPPRREYDVHDQGWIAWVSLRSEYLLAEEYRLDIMAKLLRKIGGYEEEANFLQQTYDHIQEVADEFGRNKPVEERR